MMLSAALLAAVLVSSASTTLRSNNRYLLAQLDEHPVDCSNVVEKVLSETDGQLLSLRTNKDRCTVTILVRDKPNQRPRKVILRIDRKDAQ